MLGREPRHAVAHGLVAAVMQTGGLLKDLTVRDTLRYTASLFADTAPVDDVLEVSGIAAIADRKVGKCSGGEQQRLRFAMALLPDPALLVLDEPTTGMDVEGRRSSGRRSGATPTVAGRCCSPPTTSTRPTATPTASCCSATAGSWPTAPAARSRR